MTPQDVSVTRPVGQAIDRVKRVLFQRFNAGKWFVIGFCAWLASLGGGGFHGGFNYRGGGGGGANVQRWFEQARDYVMHNLWWVIPVAVGTAIMGVAVWVLLLWLRS